VCAPGEDGVCHAAESRRTRTRRHFGNERAQTVLLFGGRKDKPPQAGVEGWDMFDPGCVGRKKVVGPPSLSPQSRSEIKNPARGHPLRAPS
jgi:hypothetical protein